MKRMTIAAVALIFLIATGCISRTIERPPTLAERSRGGGRVTESKIIWIWQGEFWSKE